MWLTVSLIWVVLTLSPNNINWLILKLRKPPVIPDNEKPFYREYINSSKWRAVRYKRLVKDRFVCQNCNVLKLLLSFLIKPKLQVHHKTYVRLGKEKQSDLITLCTKCHNKIHKRK